MSKPRRFGFEGVEAVVSPVRAVHHELSSCYEVVVDGVRRGYVGYCNDKRHDAQGWRVFVFGHERRTEERGKPRLVEDRAVRVWVPADDLRQAVGSLVARIAEGKAPTPEEARARREEENLRIVREHDERNRARDEDEAARRREREADEAARREEVEGLLVIRERLSGSLTNMEVDHLIRAAERLRGDGWA